MYFALGDYLCMEYGCKGKYMKETPRQGLRLCRLLMKYSKSAGKQGGWGGKGGGLLRYTSFYSRLMDRRLNDDLNGFYSTSEMCSMGKFKVHALTG